MHFKLKPRLRKTKSNSYRSYDKVADNSVIQILKLQKHNKDYLDLRSGMVGQKEEEEKMEVTQDKGAQ